MRQPEQYLVPRGVARPEFLKLSYCSTIDLQCELFLSHQWKQADRFWHSNRVQVHGLRWFSSIILFRFQLESSGSARHVSIPNAKVRATTCCYSLSGWLHTDRIQEVKSRSLKETDSLKQSPLDLQGIEKAAICKEWHRPYCSSQNCVPSFWALWQCSICIQETSLLLFHFCFIIPFESVPFWTCFKSWNLKQSAVHMFFWLQSLLAFALGPAPSSALDWYLSMIDIINVIIIIIVNHYM